MQKAIITKSGHEAEYQVDFAATVVDGSLVLRIHDKHPMYEIVQSFEGLDKIVYSDDVLDIQNEYAGPYILASISRVSDEITMKLIKGE